MLDDDLVTQLSNKLHNLRVERSEDAPLPNDINDLIADTINGLETLFIILNARVAQETKPQARGAVFVATSKPQNPKRI